MRAAIVLVALLLAGCTGATVEAPEFTLAPDRIGWNVGEVASFTLALANAADGATYTIDPVFAVQSLAFDTGGLGGDLDTGRPEDLYFHLVVENVTVAEQRLDARNASVQLRMTLPDSLKDDAYTLEVVLFQGGTVESAPFRVNRP